MNKLQPALPGLVIAAGIITLLASSLEEERITAPPVPVTVEYSLTTPASLVIEQETLDATVTLLSLTGSYEANSGDGLTLDRTIVDLDMSGLFTLTIEGRGDELLDGAAEIEITETLDFSLEQNPTRGAFTSLFDTTPTFVTVAASRVEVSIGQTGPPVSLSWSDFAAREADADADLNERMASAAYNTLSAILRAALVAEDIVTDIETNSSMLQSMGSDPLQIDCDNQGSAEGDTPVARLTWTDNTTDAGQGEVGANDFFEAFFTNCRDTQRDRYLDGRAELSDYVPDEGGPLRTLRVSIQLSDFFNSQDPVTRGVTRPTAASPRYLGELELAYVEVARPPPAVN